MKTILCFAIFFCTVQLFAQEYTIKSIPKELTQNTNSVVLNEVVEIDATNIAKIKTKTLRVVAVLNKLGDNDVNLYEDYNENSTVKKIEARIYDSSGKEINRFRKKNFHDISRTDGSIYEDSRALYLNYTPVTYPYIVVFESETESGDSAIIQPWFPLGGYAESTQKSVRKIKFDPFNKPRYKAMNLDGFDISISETPDELILTATNLNSIRYEEQGPSYLKIFPIVWIAFDNFKLKGVVGSAADWKEFGRWMEDKLLADMRTLPEGTVARVKSLVANETTNEGKARKIYQYVQDKVRYISIQIGIGGWKPMPASQVDKLGYGDCKALTNYTKALLDVVGVPSYYTVVYGKNDKWDILDDFASIQGNHVILGVPDGDKITWLECTSQDNPYGFIGNFTDDRNVLMLTPEGGKITRTKAYDTDQNLRKTSTHVVIDANGNVAANYQSTSSGLQYNERFYLPKKKQDEIDYYYKNRWSHINGFSISKVDFLNDREEIAFTENLVLEIPNYANSIGQDYLFCPNIFSQNSYIPPRIEERLQTLDIRRGFITKDSVEVQIPENFTVSGLPEANVLETKFGKYEINYEKIAENTFIYTRKLRIEEGEYQPSEYENYRDFLRSISRMDKTKILLKRNI
jgi:transglutaminase-like putative cysteine protease